MEKQIYKKKTKYEIFNLQFLIFNEFSMTIFSNMTILCVFENLLLKI